MEPVSAASGIAGLIAVAFKTIQLVTEYVNLAHEHKKHAEMLNKELLLLKEVLDQLKNFINEEKRNGRMMTVNDEDRNTVLGRAFAHCTSTIEEIQDKLKEPLSRFKKAMAKLKWPFEQKEVLRLVDNLRRYTQLFQLSLTVSNCDLLSKTFDVASEGLKSQREKSKEIQRLCEGIPHIAKAAEETLAQTETLLKLVPTFLQEVSLGIREIGLAQRLAEQREQGEQLYYSIHQHRTIYKYDTPCIGRCSRHGGWIAFDSFNSLSSTVCSSIMSSRQSSKIQDIDIQGDHNSGN